ncbi:hypothetical protein [Rhizobium rhizogenes]|uniref:hypothetical protein n=1 Tax=Rhizobium rhizogenes TaxID=359 RepID=UPI0024BDD123|nr:hypothetical protein [Rhizobium rhizogenes]MDJ1632652.1 hypothetical protein [Rhizobium rhizogenes]
MEVVRQWVCALVSWPWKENASLIGIGISLAWNLLNTLLNNRQWRRNQNFTEFRSLKPPIDVALGKLRESKKKLMSLRAFGGDANSFNEDLKTINKEFSENWNNLIVALESCDNSSHWPHSDLSQRYDDQWDRIVVACDAIYTQGSLDAKQRETTHVAGHFGDLINQINKEIDKCVADKIKGRSLFRKLFSWWGFWKRK